MKITQITAARLVNTGNYENTRFEAAAVLDDGEDPTAAMVALQGALVLMIRAERERRYPHTESRRYIVWVEEDEPDQA